MSDFYFSAIENERQLSPIIFTLAPCGSLKTLKFMEWLGIEVPRWLYNDLKNSKDILEASVHTCKNIAMEIMEFASTKNIPIGFNIESVSIKKDEIEAANELLIDILRLSKHYLKENNPIVKPADSSRPNITGHLVIDK
ncbi:MAG: hypothetical protein EOP48_26025 [Sphingobacteriales bacterium]|nr:MAG: hypothetical protein EOP48_26025 [Sphingobacteriales bacterium]